MAQQYKEELDLIREAIEKIFEHMREMGMVTQEMELKKKDIIDDLVEHISKNKTEEFSIGDLKDNKDVQKKMMGAIASKALGIDNKDNPFLKDLCSNDAKYPTKELDKKLQMSLLALTEANTVEKTLSKNPPSPSPDNKPKDKDEEKKEGKKDKTYKELLREEMENAERNLLGGVTAGMTGKVPSIIEGPVYGNLKGFPSQSTPDPKSLAFMTMSITYNSNAPDPLGLEGKLKTAEVANSGIIDGIGSALTSMTDIKSPTPEFGGGKK